MTRKEYGTDGNVYQLSISNGKEFSTCGDAVSREAAIIALTDLSDSYADKGKEYHPHIDFVIDTIKSLPSVQPTRSKGKWIVYKAANTGEILSSQCDQCGYEVFRMPKFNFCPNCGTEMKGGE